MVFNYILITFVYIFFLTLYFNYVLIVHKEAKDWATTHWITARVALSWFDKAEWQ